MHKIAIATEGAYAKEPWHDDRWLKEALEHRGHMVDVSDWKGEADWLSYDAIFVSTTWDIPAATQDFLSWIDRCEAGGRRILNHPDIIRFGLFKDVYLTFLNERAGCSGDLRECLIPTGLFIGGDQQTISFNEALRLMDAEHGCAGQDIVIKPIVSADGYKTKVLKRSAIPLRDGREDHALRNEHDARDLYNGIMEEKSLRGVMMQPYVRGIEEGEYSLTFAAEKLVCSIKKPGGFRNDRSRDRIYVGPENLPADMIETAYGLISLLRSRFDRHELARLRIDFILDGGRPKLCEIELVDPNCNFSVLDRDTGPEKRNGAVSALADALLRSIDAMKQDVCR